MSNFLPIDRFQLCITLTPEWQGTGVGYWLDACTPFQDPSFLKCASEKGYHLTVVDLEPRQPEVIQTDLQKSDPQLSSRVYDFITCLDTLEHLQDYIGAINTLKGYLADNGILIISVPSLGSSNEIGDSEHLTLDPKLPDHHHHCWQYNPDRLRRELLAEGFAIMGEYTGYELDTYLLGHFYILRKR